MLVLRPGAKPPQQGDAYQRWHRCPSSLRHDFEAEGVDFSSAPALSEGGEQLLRLQYAVRRAVTEHLVVVRQLDAVAKLVT